MSSALPAPGRTRTAPARAPDGYPMSFGRYRNYILFALTAFPMMLFCFELIWGLSALSNGPEAWSGFLTTLGSPILLIINVIVLIDTLYFAFRFGWVGRKIAVGRIGPIPSPPLPMAILGIAPLGGFVTLWLVVLLVIGGVLP